MPAFLKSKIGILRPISFAKGTTKLPKQQSTWNPTLYYKAIFESAGISSIAPWGNVGTEPTICLFF